MTNRTVVKTTHEQATGTNLKMIRQVTAHTFS